MYHRNRTNERKITCGLEINNYNVWRKERTHKKGGGIMIMTKKDLTGVEIEQMPTTYAEVIALEIKTQNKGLG